MEPTRAAARRRGGQVSRIAAAAAMLLLIVGGAGCSYRGNVPVELAAITYAETPPALSGPVTLCLSKQLRNRTWREDPRFYTIHLGRKAAVALEQLVKASIREVRVDFAASCGERESDPWLDAELSVADRALDDYGDAVTRVVLTLTLFDRSGRSLWTHAAEGRVVDPLALFELDHREAARDFGQALEVALEQTYESLSAAEAVRSALGPEAPAGANESPSS